MTVIDLNLIDLTDNPFARINVSVNLTPSSQDLQAMAWCRQKTRRRHHGADIQS